MHSHKELKAYQPFNKIGAITSPEPSVCYTQTSVWRLISVSSSLSIVVSQAF